MGAKQNAMWRPAQWQTQPAMVQLIVPPTNPAAAPVNTQNLSDTGIGTTTPVKVDATSTDTGALTLVYVFDAVFSLEHQQRLVKTSHPVQSGANINSHAYLEPPTVSMHIGMSDAMQQYAAGLANGGTVQPGPNQATAMTAAQWSGSSQSKSVRAYEQLLQLQQARKLLTIVTRLRTYRNMLITDVAPFEDARTVTGLRARVVFETIITAAIGGAAVSALPNDTQGTGLGTISGQAPNAATLNQYVAPTVLQRIIKIPGAGILSSLSGVSTEMQNLTNKIPNFLGALL
jgi:hypothetical protein